MAPVRQQKHLKLIFTIITLFYFLELEHIELLLRLMHTETDQLAGSYVIAYILAKATALLSRQFNVTQRKNVLQKIKKRKRKTG